MLQKKWKEDMISAYETIILDIIAKSDYAGICGHFCDCFLEEVYACMPHISTKHFLVLFKFLNLNVDSLEANHFCFTNEKE